MSEQIDGEIESRFRAEAADALVAASKVDVGGPLVETRTRELLRGVARQVEARGVPLETYLAMTGQSPEELISRLEDEARRSVARELVLEAVADKLGIDVPDTEVEALVREQAELVGRRRRRSARRAPRERALRDAPRRPAPARGARPRRRPRSSRSRKAQAEAREAIWTPDKENAPTETKLWTPAEGAPK